MVTSALLVYIIMSEFSFRKKRGLSFYRKQIKIKKGLISNILECVLIALIMAFVAFVVVRFFGIKTVVVGNSMEPVLKNNQEVFLDRMIYVVSGPKRGDVIAFLPKGNDKTHYYVKRVLGLPGETVQIKNGKIYIDGAILSEEYGIATIKEAGIAANEFVLGPEEYFVLGDNRNSSEDSRSGNIGAVKKEDIYGKVWYKKKIDDRKGGFLIFQ